MTGYIIAGILLLVYLGTASRASFWKDRYRELRKSALKDQRKLKTEIDKLQAGARS